MTQAWWLMVIGSAAWIYWIYDGYYRVVRSIGRRSEARERGEGPAPSVAVLVTVRNEESRIVRRLDNLMAGAPEGMPITVYVASDGSTDRTDERVAGFEDDRVKLVRPEGVTGKSAVQNYAVSTMGEDVVILTDADTLFATDTIARLVAPFGKEEVGCTTGRLVLRDAPGAVATAQATYWDREMIIRAMESRLGVLVTASGACMAVRRDLFPELDPCVGEDCTIPLFVATRGFRVQHVDEAVAEDEFHTSVGGELRARARMTERNWRGTWAFSTLLNPFRRPGIATCLWSHKVLRWLSPLPFTAALVAAVALLWGYLGATWALAFAGLVVVTLVFGGLAHSRGAPAGPVGLAFGLALANAGFALGVGRALFRSCDARYR